MGNIGTLGFAAFSNQRKIVMGIASFLCGLSMLLFIVAMSGWSTTTNTLQNGSAWATLSGTITGVSFTSYFGLQSFVVVSNSSATSVQYDNSDCSNFGACDCLTSGKAALGLTLFSFLLLIIVFALCIVRCKTPDKVAYKISNTVLLSLISLFILSAFGAFHNMCTSELSASDSTASNGPAFGCEVAGFMFMLVVLALNLATPSDESNSIEMTDDSKGPTTA